MERFDVIIVGGGPAGSSCAWRLVDAGLSVLIIDKKQFPRDKVCAGWVTPAVVQSLQLDTRDYARTNVFQPINRFVTGLIDGTEVHTDYAETVSFGIRRREFDHYLLQRAKAQLLLGETVRTLEQDGDGWVVNGHLHGRLLVGAGGHFCPVAKQLSGERERERVIAAQEIEFEMTPEQTRNSTVKADRPELFFCRDLAGYGWCFRKGNHLNVGLGREGNHQLARHVDEFVAFLRARGKLPAGVEQRFHGHAYLLYQHAATREPLAERALLIGDAVGLAYPQSGEGIRPAVESGLIAAETIIEARGSYGKNRLADYPQRMRTRFGTPRRPLSLPQGVKARLGGALLASPWFARHIVLDRWFLHRRQAPLSIAASL